MRITKRLLKWNRHVTRLACLLAVCSLFYACKDEYILDEEMPERLGTNLYDNLLQRGNFTNYLRLLSDPDINVKGATSMQEVLQRTGSKTLFVANDEAWNEFFRKNAGLPESNPWHNATSYANLSAAQKKLLLHSTWQVAKVLAIKLQFAVNICAATRTMSPQTRLHSFLLRKCLRPIALPTRTTGSITARVVRVFGWQPTTRKT